MKKILVADDHDVMRKGIVELLSEHKGWMVCGEACTGQEAASLARKCKPDVAILDIAMPEMTGLEAARQIRKEVPDCAVLIFTMHDTAQLVHDVLTAGALGYVLKSDAARHLVTAVETLLAGRPYFSAKVSEKVLDGYLNGPQTTPAAAKPLTRREREIAALLAEGKSNKEVADALSISIKTAETHRAAIMRKLRLGSFAELVRYAIREQMIAP